MIPPVPATPVTAIAIPQQSTSTAQSFGTFQGKDRLNQVSSASFAAGIPLTSPDINSPPVSNRIAQSELPGGSTPPEPRTIQDTGRGYPTRIPVNYIGPAISFGNGASSFGAVSRFAIGEKYSIRPSATFGSNGTTVRVPLTYDFGFGEPDPFEANPLTSFHAGAGVEFASGGGSVAGDKFSLLGTVGVDLNLFPGVAILADFNTNFGSTSGVTVGLGFEF